MCPVIVIAIGFRIAIPVVIKSMQLIIDLVLCLRFAGKNATNNSKTDQYFFHEPETTNNKQQTTNFGLSQFSPCQRSKDSNNAQYGEYNKSGSGAVKKLWIIFGCNFYLSQMHSEN